VANLVALAILTIFVLTFPPMLDCRGDDRKSNDQTERRRSQLLEQMRSLAEQTKVQFANRKEQPQLAKNPVFRYDDQPRWFIDATMWVWTDAGRPVAFEKIEAKYHVETGVPQWGYCFTSVAEHLLTAEWARAPAYRSKEAGVSFRPIPEAPAVAERDLQRKQQMRQMIRQFSATMLMNPRTGETQEMRLLSTPIYEYTHDDAKLRGAVFGFATNGTNPDLLVLIEVRGEEGKKGWHFAPARMTSGGVTLKRKEEKLWQVDWVHGSKAPFPTWTFFETPRAPVAGEGKP
jgi:hypothetical protein